MRPVIIAVAVGVAAFATTVAATATSPLGPPPPSGTGLPDDQCLLSHEVGNHKIVDGRTLLVDGFGRSKGVYRFSMSNGCLRSAISSDPIGIQQVGGGRICKPTDLALSARSGLCAVDSIVKLSPEEVAALPRRLRP